MNYIEFKLKQENINVAEYDDFITTDEYTKMLNDIDNDEYMISESITPLCHIANQ